MKFEMLAQLSLLLLTSAMLPLNAQAQSPQRNASMAQAVKRVMAKQFEISPIVNAQRKPFCEAFLRDFRQQANIEFIEPAARAGSHDDPVWQPYRARCPDLGLFDAYECMAKDFDYSRTLTKAEGERYRKSVCRQYRGTANFKLYVVDINNNPQDGKEHVFYSERAQGPLNYVGKELTYRNGGYAVVNLDRCEAVASAEAHDPYSFLYKRPLENYTGIIRYQGAHYIFDLYQIVGSDSDPKKPDYSLRLDGYASFGNKTKPRLGPVCAFGDLRVRSQLRTHQLPRGLQVDSVVTLGPSATRMSVVGEERKDA